MLQSQKLVKDSQFFLNKKKLVEDVKYLLTYVMHQSCDPDQRI